jgi:hypothetical protein
MHRVVQYAQAKGQRAREINELFFPMMQCASKMFVDEAPMQCAPKMFEAMMQCASKMFVDGALLQPPQPRPYSRGQPASTRVLTPSHNLLSWSTKTLDTWTPLGRPAQGRGGRPSGEVYVPLRGEVEGHGLESRTNCQ